MNFANQIVGQFACPHGALGHFAGLIMANRPSNIERNTWTLDLLDLHPADRLLEVGFGPGIAIEYASRVVTNGLIVGIDHSHAMLKQAAKRNKNRIAQGRVRLFAGSVHALPDEGMQFNKIFSANVVQFWADPVCVFSELKRRLAPGGILATTYMPRHRGATREDALTKASSIQDQLHAAGFSAIRCEEKPLGALSAICVLGRHSKFRG